jgi:hypothetical protein
MSEFDFSEKLTNIDFDTQWFLEEVVYCLIKYAGLEAKKAYALTVSHTGLIHTVKDCPEFLWHDGTFYWAMFILHGNLWFHSKDLWQQYEEYKSEGRSPTTVKHV